MRDRLIQLMQLLGVSPTQFANQIGVQRATLQHILSGRNEASLKIVTGINQAYPSVNLQWLLYGKGQAIEQLEATESTCTDSQKHDDNLIFPYKDMVAPEYQNLSKLNPIQNQDNSLNDRMMTDKSVHQQQPLKDKRIKDIIVLYDDGTYKKFIPALDF